MLQMSEPARLDQAVILYASLAGVPVDAEQVHDIVHEDIGNSHDMRAPVALGRGLGWEEAIALQEPDPAYMPLLAYCEGLGWGVLTERKVGGAVIFAWRETGETAASRGQSTGSAPHKDDGGLRRIEIAGSERLAVIYRLQPRARAGTQSRSGFREELHQLMWRHRGLLLEGVAGSVFINLMAIATSLFALQVYDKVIPTRSMETLAALAFGVLLFILFEWVMKWARSRVMEQVTIGLDQKLARSIFQRVLNIRLDQLPGSVGSLAAQVRGYEQVRSFYTATTLFTLVDIPSALIFIAIIMYVASPLIALIPLSLGLLAIALGLLAARRLNRHAQASAVDSYRKTGLLVEAVEGAETIKLGNGRWRFLRRWLDLNERTLANDVGSKRTSELLQATSASIQQTGYVTTVTLGAVLVMNADMTMGALIATSILGGRVLASIMSLPNLLVQRSNALAAMAGLEKLYALEPDNAGVDRPLTPDMLRGNYALEKVSFAYDEDRAAFHVEQLRIASGERIGIVGPVGSGKSTLLKLLAGLYKPQKGRVLVDGLDLAQVATEVAGTQIGYLPQDLRLFEGTLRENIAVGTALPEDGELIEVMRRTGLDQVVAGHAKGVDLPIHEGGMGLSGGQRQIVGFTRLLLRPTPILLLDEPTAAMDDASEDRCMDLLAREATAGATLVLATHKPRLLKLVDRLLVVHQGRLVMDGPRDAILRRLSEGRA